MMYSVMQAAWDKSSIFKYKETHGTWCICEVTAVFCLDQGLTQKERLFHSDLIYEIRARLNFKNAIFFFYLQFEVSEKLK